MRIGPILAARDEFVPGADAALLKRGHEVPQRRPGHMVSEAGIPGNRDAEREMLVEPEIAAELAFHKRERTLDRGARGLDLLDRMRRFELHPIDAGLFAIGLEAQQRVLETAICGVARVALRHDDNVRVVLDLHFDGGPVHDPGMSRGRRMQHRQHLVPPMDQLLQARALRAVHGGFPSRVIPGSPEGRGPESINTGLWKMDSGLAAAPRPGMTTGTIKR